MTACNISGQASCNPGAQYIQTYNAEMTKSIFGQISQILAVVAASYPFGTGTSGSNIGSPNTSYYIGAVMEMSRYSGQYRTAHWLPVQKFMQLEDYVGTLSHSGVSITNHYDSVNGLSVDSLGYWTSISNVAQAMVAPHIPGAACTFIIEPGHYNSNGECVPGAPTASSGSGSGSYSSSSSGYQCPTTKKPFDPDWIQSHGSYWAAASAHDAYVQCLKTGSESSCHSFYTTETQYCGYAKPACLAVPTNAADCPG